MKLIQTIHDIDLGMDLPSPTLYEKREAARAIVFDTDKSIALLHATKKHYHKLPGGGLDPGEDIETALRREVLEEIGCAIKNLKELGTIEEYRNKYSLHQISYCFLADIDGSKGEPHLEEDEIADGFETVWLSLPEAIMTLEQEADVEDYEGKFIRHRDLLFLEAAKSSL